MQKKERILLKASAPPQVCEVSLPWDAGSSGVSHFTSLLRECSIRINVDLPHSVQIPGQVAFWITMVLIISCIGWLWDIWIERNCSGFLNLPNNKNHLNLSLTSSQVYGHAAISSCRNGWSSSVSEERGGSLTNNASWRPEYTYTETARCQKQSEAQGQSPQTLTRVPTPCPWWPMMIASCCDPGWGCPISKPYVAWNMKILPNYQHLDELKGQAQKSDASPCKWEGLTEKSDSEHQIEVWAMNTWGGGETLKQW